MDDCFAIPFVNDTHLANDPARDPDFDDGLPRSEFQEVFSWLVPNAPEFGGSGVGCVQEPEEAVHVTGGGQVPGKDGQGVASFGLNARSTGDGATGNIHLKDHGTGQMIRTVSVDSVVRSGDEVLIQGTCRIDGGKAQACEISAVDRAGSGAGADEFRVQVGSDYSGGGMLARGNVQVH